jgi:hypothetical protein
LVSGAILLYRLLRSLGIGLSGDDRTDLSWALGAAIAAGGTVAYHLRVLLDDQRLRDGERLVAPVPAPDAASPGTLIILLGGGTPGEQNAAITALRGALPASATVESFPAEGVTAGDVRAWLATQVRAQSASESPDAPRGASAPVAT